MKIIINALNSVQLGKDILKRNKNVLIAIKLLIVLLVMLMIQKVYLVSVVLMDMVLNMVVIIHANLVQLVVELLVVILVLDGKKLPVVIPIFLSVLNANQGMVLLLLKMVTLLLVNLVMTVLNAHI